MAAPEVDSYDALYYRRNRTEGQHSRQTLKVILTDSQAGGKMRLPERQFGTAAADANGWGHGCQPPNPNPIILM